MEKRRGETPRRSRVRLRARRRPRQSRGPTQWFERSALNYGHVIKAMQSEAHVINRNLFRETIYGVATNGVSSE